MNNFQLGLSITCVVAFLLAVAIFSGIIDLPGRSKDSSGATGTVVLWGTIDDGLLAKPLETFNFQKSYQVRYTEKNPETFDQDLIEALASGKGPDLVLMPADMLWHYKDKAFIIPYATYSERAYLDGYIPEASLYLMKDGILALPFSIDPLVLYYNRDYFTGAGIVNYPKTWDDVVADVPLLVSKDANGTILRSAIALGTYSNVTHAKDIVSLLLLQVGNPIVSYDRNTDALLSTLKSQNSAPSEQALEFYLGFADPAQKIYTWNSGLPEGKDAFIAGDVAMYIGYASELAGIRGKNPNLNFDLVGVPQLKGAQTRTTYGNMQGLMIMNASGNKSAAYVASALLSGTDFLSSLLPSLPLPPVRRDLLIQKPIDPVNAVFYDSALIAKGWIDPDSEVSDNIFSTLLKNIGTGILNPAQALAEAQGTFSLYLERLK